MRGKTPSRSQRMFALVAIAATFLVFGARQAAAQAIIKVNDNINFKVGFLLQPQADWQQLVTADGTYGQNFLLRRVRFIVGGQFAKNVFFFAETENSRLGQATVTNTPWTPTSNPSSTSGTKSPGTGFVTLDAVVEWRIRKEFNLQGGLVRIPVSREALKAAGSNLAMDTSAYTFQTGTPLQSSSAERDTGIMARGYFFKDHFEYRFAGFSGIREAASATSSGSKNSYRGVARVQYNVFDTEVYNMPSYPGSYLGTKRILALGFAYDFQKSYKSASADLYTSIPIGGGAIEGTVQVQYVDGGTTVPTLPELNTEQFEAGWYMKALKTAVYARFEQKHLPDSRSTEQRTLFGINHYIYGHNFNIKAGWGKVHFPHPNNPTRNANQFTLQLQYQYF